MKLIDLTCSKCGATLQVNPDLKKCMCQYCGNEMLIDDETIHHNLNCIKYIKSRTLRFLVNCIKSTQHSTKEVYKLVPLQDFSEHSDIDWSQSISNIDQQLYKKYKLTEEEIAYIEKTIKPMQ